MCYKLSIVYIKQEEVIPKDSAGNLGDFASPVE